MEQTPASPTGDRVPDEVNPIALGTQSPADAEVDVATSGVSQDSQNIWAWWICGLLLFATTINYMDRQALTSVSARIKSEFELTNAQYGWLESGFGLSFAVGASLFGVISDRTNVRWLYPIVLLLWSLMGFCTGFVNDYMGLIICRSFLGLFEAGHWPCALKTTLRILPPQNRTLGNSILQSGSAIGAIVTPLIMLAMLRDAPGSWRPAFQIIAAVGVLWAVVWTLSTHSVDLAPIKDEPVESFNLNDPAESFLSVIRTRKFLLLVIVVIAINTCWHFFRVWMPLFLQNGRDYNERQMLWFMSCFYIMCDIGCIAAGFSTRLLLKAGFDLHSSRTITFGGCALLVTAGCLIPLLASGPALILVLMLVGAGSLGLFPCYYTLSQELSIKHQGKVTGILGTITWLTSAVFHPLFGYVVDQTHSYDHGMAITCILPLVAFFSIYVFWPQNKPEPRYNADPSFA